MAVGRITGPLLKANLLRDGVDLAFETDLLYLDVINGKVGVKTTPTALDDYQLGINGTTRTTDLEVTDQADIAEFTILGNTISSTNSTINLEPSGANAVVYQGKIVTGDLQISTNIIEVTASATDLEINTLGTGKVNVNSDMQINGDLHVTGTITADGDIGGQITLGDTNTDNIVFNAEINSHVIPDVHDTYDLGSDPTLLPTPGKAWRALYADTVVSTTLELQDLTVNGDFGVTGNSTFNGDITFGNASTDTVTVNSTISSNIIPTTTDFYDIGSDSNRWADGYFSRIEIDKLVIDNNTISTTNGNDNLVLTANGTGLISLPSNDVQIDQALTVTGQTTLNGTEIAGDITHTGNVTQTGNFTQTGDTEITGNLTVSSYAQFEKIKIDSNTISTTVTNTDLTLEANGTGRVYIPSNDVLIDQNLTVDGLATIADVDVTNTLTAGSFSTGDILIDDNYITTQLTDSNLELKANGTGIVSIPNNDVEITQDLTVGQDFTVTTGTTYLKDVSVTGDITQTGDINQTGDFTTSGTAEITGNVTATGYLQVADIKLSGHTIESTATNTDLSLLPNGTGDILFEDIRVTDNTFKSTGTNQDIILQPNGVGSVIINSNQSLIIPVGTTAQRPGYVPPTSTYDVVAYSSNSDYYLISTLPWGSLPVYVTVGWKAVAPNGATLTITDITPNTGRTQFEFNGVFLETVGATYTLFDPTTYPTSTATNGMIRYNTDLDRYEGYDAAHTRWLQLSGVIDQDGNTYITAELTPGANDNTIRFVVNSALMAYIDATKLFAERFETDDIAVYDNQITTVATDTDIDFTTSGTGSVKIGNLKIRNNTITNSVSGAVTEFTATGAGYVKITGTNGVVIPSGDLSNLPTVPALGMVRFNTFYGYVEVFNGATWVNSAGATSGVTLTQAQDIGIVSALLFG